MCGSKQTFSHLTFGELPTNNDQRNAETAREAKLDLKIRISKDEIRDSPHYSVQSRINNATLSSGQALEPNKSKTELANKEIICGFTCPNLVSSIYRRPTSEISQPVSLRESQEQGSSMFSQSGNLNSGKKRSRTGDDAGLAGAKRRKEADNSKQCESMYMTYQILPSPFSNYDNSRGVKHHPSRHLRELTSAVFPTLALPNSPLSRDEVGISAVLECRTNINTHTMECTVLDIQKIKLDIGDVHKVVQELLIKCISLQRERYSIYIPSWKDVFIRTHDTSCDHHTTDNQNTPLCSATGKSCMSTRYRWQKDTHEPTHIGVTGCSLKQMGTHQAAVRNHCDQRKVRSQAQLMKLHWLNLPSKYQRRLEASARFILVLDKHLRVMFVSGNVSRHLGYQQDDMLGRSIGQFIHPKHLSDMLRLTRGRQFQTDDKQCFPLWRTGRVITIAMKFCLQKTGSVVQDAGYKPVIWTLNLRLRKRGQCVRVQDMVVLCKPVDDYTVTGLQIGRNMLINSCTRSLNFQFCKFRCELAERTLTHTGNSLSGKKCLCFGTESDLLYGNHDESTNVSKINHNCLRRIDTDLLWRQLLQPCPLNLHVCSSCLSTWWTNMGGISNNNDQSSAVKSYASMALQLSKSIYKNHRIRKLFNNTFNSTCRVSQNDDKMCTFSAACINRLTKEGTCLHHGNVKTQAGVKVFDQSDGKNLISDLEPDQKRCSTLKIPLQKVTSISCLNQTSAFSDIISPHLLMKTSTDQESIPTYELASHNASISDDSKSTCQDVTDVELAELAAENKPEPPSDKSFHESFIDVCIQNPTRINNGSKLPIQSLSTSLQLPPYFQTESTLQPAGCQCQSDAKNKCNVTGHITSDICSQTMTNRLSSILQTENISSPPVRKNINEDSLLQSCPTVSSTDSTFRAQRTVKKRSNTLLHNFLHDLANTSASNSSTLCSMSPSRHLSQCKSSNVYQQISSAVSTLSSPVSSWFSVTDQMLSASTSTPADDEHPENSTHSQDKVRINNKNISSSTESANEQPEYMSKVHRVSSKMTNQKSDPFLSQASFSDFNSFPSTDIFDDLSSVTCSVTSPLLSSVTSQIMSGADQDTQSHLKDQFSSGNFHSFLDPAPEPASFASESLSDLDSLLNTIPVSHTTNSQTILFSGWPESDTSQSSDSMSLSNYFFNKETSSRPSLLRKLLDKEGSAIQVPENNAEWILNQIPEKNNDVKKTKIHYGSTKIRYSVCRQAKTNKNTIRRSVELPKMRLNQRQVVQFNKCKPQFHKPTKELPLPSSIKEAAGASPPSAHLQQDAVASEPACPENTLDKDMREIDQLDSLDNTTDCELPDDLIDMAVECCAPFEMDQTEALISDLNDSCSWEDNLYSLLEISGQENSGDDSGTQNPQKTSEILVSSKKSAITCELLSNFFQSKDSFSTPSLSSSTPAEPSFLYHRKPNKEQSQSSSSQTSQEKIAFSQLSKTNVRGSNVPTVSTANCTNTNGNMSLLRAAITSDVDKLIEQIPLRNAKKSMCTLHRTSEEHEDDSDILITKVIGLKENHSLSSVHRPYHRNNKVISVNTIRPSETISLCKSLQSSKTTMTTSGNVMPSQSVQTFTTNMPAKGCNKQQLLQNGSSCEHCGNTTKTPPFINPLVIKISIGSSSTPKVICSRIGSQSNLSQILKPDSQNRACDQSSSPCFSRTSKTSISDLSSTHPVSVMIMRKENHRSRRSKSIAIQTDNQPGEVYPEFEHSPSDTVLYPSTIITYPSAVSPQDISPLSTPLSSHSSLSEIDKFLPSHPSTDDSSSSADDDYRTISSTPFLWKLLTGELSKDHYQRLDQQMLEKERKKASLQ